MNERQDVVAKAIHAAYIRNDDDAPQLAFAALETLWADAEGRVESLLFELGDNLESQLRLKDGTIFLATGTNCRRFVEAVLGPRPSSREEKE